MIDPVKTQIEQFVNNHHTDIQGLLLQAQQEAGGHYQALTWADRERQSEIDAAEFITALLSGAPDAATIQRTLENASGLTVATDIVNMATALDRLFSAFVSEQLQAQPGLARELRVRSSYVIARFRLSVSASQIDNLVRGRDFPIFNPETPTV